MFPVPVYTRISLHSRRYISVFSAHTLLSEANRSRCIDNLKNVPGFPFKLELTKSSAAVLIPVCVARSGDVGLLFTRRSGTLSRHVRQVSFPGGFKDSTDNSYEDCALRETEEEIGLPRSRSQVWGTGELMRIPGVGTLMPVVASIENFSLDELKLNKDEVDEAFVIPIETLCSPHVRKHTQFRTTRIPGYSAPVFIVSPHRRVWGITGYITNLFLSCLLPKEVFNSKTEYVKPYKQR